MTLSVTFWPLEMPTDVTQLVAFLESPGARKNPGAVVEIVGVKPADGNPLYGSVKRVHGLHTA